MQKCHLAVLSLLILFGAILKPRWWRQKKIKDISNLPLTLFAPAARTSASQSFNRFWKAGTRSFSVISGPTAFWSFKRNEMSNKVKAVYSQRISASGLCNKKHINSANTNQFLFLVLNYFKLGYMWPDTLDVCNIRKHRRLQIHHWQQSQKIIKEILKSISI